MGKLSTVLVCLAALAFILAVISAFSGPFAGITAEGYSQACTNLALIAIAVSVCCKCKCKDEDKGDGE